MKGLKTIIIILLLIAVSVSVLFYSKHLSGRSKDTYISICNDFTAYIALVVLDSEERVLSDEIKAIESWHNSYLKTLGKHPQLTPEPQVMSRFNEAYQLWSEINPKLSIRETPPRDQVIRLVQITTEMLDELPESHYSKLRKLLSN